ncbi:PREDICTED: basic 7S globulin-like [Nicotiana attenuata]|uniref:Basic 7s globulin n=1 Tax=Nicotiana attenuata TaxID=49451 RepID=A0A1J6K2P2_NICAT|nr:PREDICTED: basic 7S globulin-like [Nicotiana attenuata]OIT19392.1 basic 7s globulin [Nicotiana attenuata]
MSSSSYCLLHFCFLLIISTCIAQTTSRPKTLFLAVKKDPSTLQYITEIHQRTPLVPLKLAIHLGGESLWVDCEQDYESSTYKPARCNSRQCNLARSTACGSCHTGTGTRPGCNSNACYNVVENPVIDTIYTGGEIAKDVLSVGSVNGTFLGPVATMSRFIFSCAPSYLTRSLGKDVKGMIGFGQQSPVSLATQFASAFRFSRTFAICLSSTKELDVNGIIYIGQSPYLFSPGYDASRDLIYTPIITYSPSSIYINRPSSEYYIQVSSIKINGKALPLNKTLLSLDKNGNGGTRISTTLPYTVLETSIYNAVIKAFVKEMPKEVRSVPAVQPFTTCFNSRDVGMSRLGYSAPEINFVLHKQNVHWKITGANSLVEVSGDVICLAFVERRQESGQSVIVGGFQMQDNLIEFDLSKKRIGFSNSLFFRQTMCSNQGFA